MKKKIKIICIIIFVICIIYSIFSIIFRPGKELYLNSENRLKINEIINNEYRDFDTITKIKARILLGESEISLYTGPILMEKIILDDVDPLTNYVIDNGIDTYYKYISLIIFSVICLIISKIKSNREN